MASSDHFLRDHFGLPSKPGAPLTVGTRKLTVGELQGWPQRELDVVLECAGHRRAEFSPLPEGVPWEIGAVSEACWGGVPLPTVLEHCGLALAADGHLVAHGADFGPTGEGEDHFVRSLPAAKALDEDTLVAVTMNGEPIPALFGGPVRLIVPGWYATDSVKWLCRLESSSEEWPGYFQRSDYRLDGRRMGELRPQAIVTFYRDGLVNGLAWAGSAGITAVEVSVDGGSWLAAKITGRNGRYGRVFWTFHPPSDATEITVRARSGDGQLQPARAAWNSGGYANNSQQLFRLDAANR